MFKGGRQQDPVWLHFTSVMAAGKEYAKCNNQPLAKAYCLKLHNVKRSDVHQLSEAELIPEQPIATKREIYPSTLPVSPHILQFLPSRKVFLPFPPHGRGEIPFCRGESQR